MQYLVKVPCVVRNFINNSELQIRVRYFRCLRATDRINTPVHRRIGMKVWRGTHVLHHFSLRVFSPQLTPELTSVRKMNLCRVKHA